MLMNALFQFFSFSCVLLYSVLLILIFFSATAASNRTPFLYAEKLVSVILLVPKSCLSLARLVCSEDTFARLFILPGQAVGLYAVAASTLGSSSA